MTNLIVGIIITMIFSGMEIAFVSSNRLRAEMEREKNGLADKAISFFYRHPNDFVSTMLVGNNIALVVYGILFAAIFDNTLFASLNDGSRVTADTLLSTVIVLFTGEFLPKTIFKASPNTMLRFFAVPTMACYVTLFPISRFATVLSKGLLRLSGQKIDNDSADKAFTKVDLDYLVQASIDNAPDEQQIEEVKIFHNALDFSDTKVRDCMVPRTEIESVDIEKASMDQLKSRFIESGHSKIVVYREDIDHVIGYVHSSDLFRIGAKIVGEDPIPSSMIREMPYVPETMAASKLMHTFLQEKKSLAVVIDEFGGTSGLVSLEDIVEEIFGDIEDEHDNMHYVAKQLGEGEYMLSARLEIEKVNEMFSLDLPESDDYMTVGGLILHEYQSFPKLNEVVKIGHFEFKIVKNTMTKIELVRLKVEE